MSIRETMTENTSKINAEWHARHKMPKNPTLDQRVKWHIEHARHCGCRPISGKIMEEIKKKYMNTHQEFWIFFNRNDHKALAIWAADCADHVLPLFEAKYPADFRPRQAINTLREWIETGKFSMPVIRGASLPAHAAAREAREPAASYAARAAGQAVATAHVPTHAFGSALYAIKAVASSHSSNVEAAIAVEWDWQLQRIPEKLRGWVVSGLKQNERLLPMGMRLERLD